jgi:hypothetical protein
MQGWIISADVKKIFEKIQHPLHDRSPKESRTKGNVPHHNKNYSQCAKWGKKLKHFSLFFRNETKVSTLSTLIQYSARILNKSNKRRERNKGIQIGKEEI